MLFPIQLASVSTVARRSLLLLKIALIMCTAAISSSAFASTATTTSLAVTSGGVAVTSVKAGSVVTLTATVAAGSTKVTQGQVNFCDATAPHCTDIHLLATAQLTSSGTASYNFRPGIGKHSYKAVFVGTNSYASSTSSVASLKVTGTIPKLATATTIDQTGSWGAFVLSATVTEIGNTAAPTGTVSFVDSNHGNANLGTGMLGPATRDINWTTVNTDASYLVGVSYAVADLNGDGIPDLFVEDYDGTYDVVLGKGDGTFTAKGSAFGPASQTGSFVVGDFNNDGIPDVAAIDGVLYAPSNTITIFLGNGDGTFTAAASSPSLGMNPNGIATADVNGDGNCDLVVSQQDPSGYGQIVVFFGHGDGTFTMASSLTSVNSTAPSIIPSDLNGDGKIDFVLTGNGQSGITILLGNGDGTFNVVSGPTQAGEATASVADLNGDGVADLVFGAAGTGYLTVFLGNGDGTFAQAPPSGNLVVGNFLGIADLNQDGIPDLVDTTSATGALFGRGDGTFVPSQASVFLSTDGFGTPFVVADFNGDGWPDVVAIVVNGRTIEDALTLPKETAAASADVSIPVAGAHLVDASYPGDLNYIGSTSTNISLWGVPPATTTTLNLTSGGSPVTSVAPGTAVLLTAQVSAGGSPVTAGQVNFCDASAPHCTDVHTLGTSALNNSGTATLEFVPGPGTHSYQAQFVEDGYGLPSASNIASLKVGPAPNPVYSDAAAITISGGSQGDYSLMASVIGYGGPASPTGNVSFVDTSFGNTVLATAALGAGIPGNGWLISQTPPTGSNPVSEVTEDFNGDGIPDLAVIWSDSIYGGPYSVTILFGKGDGTFTAGPTVQPAGVQLYPSMIGGDFNGDGKADLAVLSYNGNSISYVTVLPGNGDGTFETPITSQVYAQSSTGGDVIIGTLASADFNGDGKLDLAVVGDYVSSGGATILIGNGDGSFKARNPNVDLTADFALIATGDFNGDGIPDFVAPNYFEFGGSPTIFLGKGDGTFTYSKVSFTLDYFPTSVLVADFNGDGILDLAFSDLNGVEIALGNGDGTFTETAASPIRVQDELYSLKLGDFNNDGKVDIAGIDNYADRMVLLLGAGDGTFTVTATTPPISQIWLGPFAMVAGDFNEDGAPDLAMLTKNVSTASILLTVPTETATVTVTGVAPAEEGTHYVDASYSGDQNYGAVTSDTIPLTGGLPPVVVSPTSLSFGDGAVGSTSRAKTVTLKNTSASTLDISSITPSGDFAISENTCGATLAAKKSCKVGITFTPMAPGGRAGMLTFTDNAANSPQTVRLSGTGVEPATLTPASAVYAKQKVRTTSKPKTFTLTNDQPVDLTGIAISTTGPFAVSSTTCEASLNTKAKCKISVTFTPTETGTQTGQLIVQDSASNSPQTSNLTGTGK